MHNSTLELSELGPLADSRDGGSGGGSDSLLPPDANYRRLGSADLLSEERAPLFEGAQEEWLVERDLDAFFQNLYEYYRDRGLPSIAVSRLLDLVTLGFTILFTGFLLLGLDWTKLQSCHDEATCLALYEYTLNPWAASGLFAALVNTGLLLLTLTWCSQALNLAPRLTRAYRTYKFYRDQLGIPIREMQTMEWCTVVSRLVRLQHRTKMQVNGPLTALTIAMRIMRKDNYLVAMINQGVLPVGSPDWTGTLQGTGQDWWMGKALEYNLYVTILNHIIDPKTFTLNKRGFTPFAIRARLRTMALLNLLLMPFILGFSMIYFFLRYAEEFHSKRNYLGPRFWTPHALWSLRELNELPHVFDRRVFASLRYSDRYLRMFPTPVPTVLARAVAFVMGGFVAVLLMFALVDESVLLHVRLGPRNLVWYTAIFSTVLAAARAVVPSQDEEAVASSPNFEMRRVAAFTHALPDKWRHRAHTYDVRDEFAALFPFRLALLTRELLCVVCMPYMLGVVLPRHADQVVEFCANCTVSEEGVGDVCRFGLMHLAQDGDAAWAFRLTGPQGVLGNGKLEKSWLGFRHQYTKLADVGAPDQAGEMLLRQVSDFQKGLVQVTQPELGSSSMWLSSEAAARKTRDVAAVRLEQEPVGAGDDLFWWVEEWREGELKKRGGLYDV
jgi:autophagy-related protein 9